MRTAEARFRFAVTIAIIIAISAVFGISLTAENSGGKASPRSEVRDDIAAAAQQVELDSMESSRTPKTSDENCVVVHQGHVAEPRSKGTSQRLIRSLRKADWVLQQRDAIDGAVTSLLSKEGWTLRIREYAVVYNVSAASGFVALTATKDSCSLATEYNGPSSIWGIV